MMAHGRRDHVPQNGERTEENATGTAAATKKVPETTEAQERHVAYEAHGLTGRVAATLVDESTLGDGQRLHDAANRSRAADVAGQRRIDRSGLTRRFAIVVVCRVAAGPGGARYDLTGGTDEADCPGA